MREILVDDGAVVDADMSDHLDVKVKRQTAAVDRANIDRKFVKLLERFDFGPVEEEYTNTTQKQHKCGFGVLKF